MLHQNFSVFKKTNRTIIIVSKNVQQYQKYINYKN